ncbi:MAG: DUF1540 domain-containing protein [Cellulomonadaceae bacterium]
MSETVKMPRISECTIAGCSYNHDGCHASAITIDNDAQCATFIPLGTKGGLSRVVASVGACQRAECKFNASLECTAPAVRIGAGGTHEADCLTYEKA